VFSVELSLIGHPPYRVGDHVDLTAVASGEAEIAVCVTGPERGTLWRGGIPGGRTPLTRGGHAQRFAFGAPGRYRFLVTSGACAEPGSWLHVVEVEVEP
jgi:hypothetical protein